MSRRSHLRWRLKKARADFSDLIGRAFTYAHPTLGRFVYHPSDWISRRVLLYGDFEAPELEFARERSEAGGVVLDVGANVGLYTVVCARAAGARGRVIAVEPGPQTFAKLRATCARLGLKNVRLVHAAAGPASGTARLVIKSDRGDVLQHLVDDRAEPDHATADVPMVRLDDVCAADVESIVLMKIDVEGHETGALAGAERILANRRVVLIVEFLPSGLTAAGSSAAELWSLLERTHRCTASFHNGRSVIPSLATIASLPEHESCNTCWLPVASLGASPDGAAA
jgi:FkbM family methyltransferase